MSYYAVEHLNWRMDRKDAIFLEMLAGLILKFAEQADIIYEAKWSS